MISNAISSQLMVMLLSTASSFAQSDTETLRSNSGLHVEELNKISHEIVYVNSFGSWYENGMHGYYRIIHLDTKAQHPHSKIYLQWIEKAMNKQDRVVASTAVTEINNAGVFKLSIPTIIQGKEGDTVQVTAVNEYSQAVQSLWITPAGITHYQLSYVSVPNSGIVDSTVDKIPIYLDFYVRPSF